MHGDFNEGMCALSASISAVNHESREGTAAVLVRPILLSGYRTEIRVMRFCEMLSKAFLTNFCEHGCIYPNLISPTTDCCLVMRLPLVQSYPYMAEPRVPLYWRWRRTSSARIDGAKRVAAA